MRLVNVFVFLVLLPMITDAQEKRDSVVLSQYAGFLDSTDSLSIMTEHYAIDFAEGHMTGLEALGDLEARGLKMKTEEYGTRFDRLSDSAYVRETARRT